MSVWSFCICHRISIPVCYYRGKILCTQGNNTVNGKHPFLRWFLFPGFGFLVLLSYEKERGEAGMLLMHSPALWSRVLSSAWADAPNSWPGGNSPRYKVYPSFYKCAWRMTWDTGPARDAAKINQHRKFGKKKSFQVYKKMYVEQSWVKRRQTQGLAPRKATKQQIVARFWHLLVCP